MYRDVQRVQRRQVGTRRIIHEYGRKGARCIVSHGSRTGRHVDTGSTCGNVHNTSARTTRYRDRTITLSDKNRPPRPPSRQPRVSLNGLSEDGSGNRSGGVPLYHGCFGVGIPPQSRGMGVQYKQERVCRGVVL